ncbi:hypothetical protein [Pseudaminobacter salicylatoxidans]|uniref:hypothetical protein n=1 Tax=Pseudaminobacter salicylatoxidans TaxID=93369 RepID=UPI0002E60F9C|nr:hypothetical protein [Pseudaminobacter salicylatoxidans]
MTTFNYAKSQATAERLLKKFGRAVTLKRLVPGGGSPWDPGEPTWQEYPATAAVLPASKDTIEAFDNRLEGGTLIDEQLRYVLMSAVGLPVEPKSLDVVNFDNNDWVVLGCTPLNPAGTPVLYPMGVKRQ